MKKINNNFIKKILKPVYQFFITIHIFESHIKFKKVNIKDLKISFIKNLNQLNANKKIKNYFNNSKFKFKRFKNKSVCLVIKRKMEIVSVGWIHYGNEWIIEEINKKIKLNKRYLIYDYITEKKFRNRGYFKLWLKIAQNKFINKKFIIYSLSHNYKSIKAIKKTGFKLIEKQKKY